MRKISISPSLLESYRIASLGLYGKTGDDLANDIIGPRVPNEAMSRGTAYHRLIEEGGEKFIFPNDTCPATYIVAETELGKFWEFSKEAADPAFKIRDQYPNMIHEMKAVATLQVRGYEVEMRMRLDGLDGAIVHEFKTKSKPPAMMDYYHALQWRCYMLPFSEIQAVKYTVFHLNDTNTTCTPHSFTFEREGENERIVSAQLNGFLHWLELRPDLLDHLEQKALRPDYL